MIDEYDVIVVGSGIAGLISASFLTKSGKKILVLEQNNEVGGYFNTFSNQGYKFDGGIRAVEDGGMLTPLLKKLGVENRIDFERSITSMMFPDKLIELYSRQDIKAYFEFLKEKFPDEVSGLIKVQKLVRDISGLLDIMSGNPDSRSDKSFMKLLLSPYHFIKNLRFFFKVGTIKKALLMDLVEFLESNINNPGLVNILSQKFFVGTPAFFGLGYSQIFLDYYYIKGGMQNLPKTLANFIKENNNEIKCKALVKNIILKNDTATGVILSDGTEIKSKTVIWAGDGDTLFNDVIPERFLSSDEKENLNRAKPCEGNFSLFLGLDIPTNELPFKNSSHIFYTPNYIGSNYIDRYENPEYFRLASQELSVPTKHDPSMAPPGKSCLCVSVVATPEYSDHWKIKEGKRTPEYNELKKQVADQILDNLSKIIPNIREKIEVQIMATPYTNLRYTLNNGGSITGWSQDPKQTFNKKSIFKMGKMIYTPVKNLYQVGQWAYTPAGVPTCLISGYIAANHIKKQLK